MRSSFIASGGRTISKVLVINKPEITENEETFRLVYRVKMTDGDATYQKAIWFESDINELKNLSKTANGIVTGLLPFALKEGYDINTDLTLDPTLLHNLNNVLIPFLCANDNRFHKSKITANKELKEKY